MTETGLQRQCLPHKMPPDKWDSARFMNLFLAAGLYCSQAKSSPAHLQVTPALRRLSPERRNDENSRNQNYTSL